MNLIAKKFFLGQTEEYSFDRFKMNEKFAHDQKPNAKNITLTNINCWNMTKNVRQRLTITDEYDQSI